MNSPTPDLSKQNAHIQTQNSSLDRTTVERTTAFAPLPIRARTTLEVLDTAVKMYRRYFGVLILWSLVTAAAYLASSIVPMGSLLTMPLMYGAVACAIAAAVRGEKITFGQVWDFTKPRYGSLIGVTLLSLLIVSVAAGVCALIGTVVSIFVAYLLDGLPSSISVVLTIIGFVLLIIAYFMFCTVAFGWMSLVPIVACLEDDNRGVAALGRAWNLFKGHWKRVFVITALLGISCIICFGIIGGFVFLIGSSLDVFTSLDESTILGLAFGTMAMVAILMVFWSPAQAMIMAVLYLDLRVRKEALDIEWVDYTSKPPVRTFDGNPTQAGALNPNAIEPLHSEPSLSPSSFEAGRNMAEAGPNASMPPASVPPTGYAPAALEFQPAPSEEAPTNPFSGFNSPPAPASPVQLSKPVDLTPEVTQTSTPIENLPEPVMVQPSETSSFAPPSFSVDASPTPSPWGVSNTSPAPSQEATGAPSSPNPFSFDVQPPDEPKPEDSHEPRF